MNPSIDKGAQLLAFLEATATIRRKRNNRYGSNDKVIWLAELPRDRRECRSPFLSEEDALSGLWLEVQKQRMPARPAAPQVVRDWVRVQDLDQAEKEPELLPEITVLVERKIPDPDAPDGRLATIMEKVPELRRLGDHPEVEERWLEYLLEKWEPWSQEMRRWQELQSTYEQLDFMRRRLEEAEERYELVLALGYLQWRDRAGVDVARHVLTAPAELTLDAARGVLSVIPAASFEHFRLELDMLELQHRPRLNEETIAEKLEELDAEAWNTARVAQLMSEIANSFRADAQVDERCRPADRIEERPRISFAPALVLRERRPTAYEDLIHKFVEAADGGLEGTAPWLRLLREGDGGTDGSGNPINPPIEVAPAHGLPERILFPLPTNEEQREIVSRLQSEPCVVVKGPPGTGKSHTIANLICHLLARGDRVLVTAQAPKALSVLRGLLPKDIRDLCVTALGSSRDDQRLLEESVRGILRRNSEWRGPEIAQRAIEKAEEELRELEGKLAQVERDLRTFREAETYAHQLPGGYSGTAAQIARQIGEQEREFGWFPELPADAAFPLDTSESEFLAEAHAYYGADARANLELETGAVELPGPDEFQSLVERLNAAEDSARRANRRVDEAKLEFLEHAETKELRMLRDAVQALTELALRVNSALGEVSETILKDLLVSADARWARQAADSEALLNDATRLLQALGSARVELTDAIAEDRLIADVERRLTHFEAGGRKGFWVIGPRVVRETRYIANGCRVNGKQAGQIGELRCLRDFLELRREVRDLWELWGASLSEGSSLTQAVSRAGDLTAALRELLAFFKSEQGGSLTTLLGPNRAALGFPSGREEWLRAIDALVASREAHKAQQELERLLDIVRDLQLGGKAHPTLRDLEDAARVRDALAWRTAWQVRERVLDEKKRLARYDGLLEKLDGSCVGIAELLRRTGGQNDWNHRVRTIRKAWNWAAAREWLRRTADDSAYEARVQEYHRLKQKIEKVTENLASLQAWRAFFVRLDDKTVQNLIAWTKALDRIGQGFGVHANSHRRTARRYLMECVPSIPAWVMPLHKLWDSIDAVPGLFDTVIVDEASQSGVEAVALFLLAKRIVVVGDSKQNSPEAVGVPEEDIARLAREHLDGFRFQDEFRPDSSLFDHAERAFGSHSALREHFRCVPEIIRFSNDLCYRDTPLIPLRQPPPDRLPPLLSRFVAEGSSEGKGPRIVNQAEAEAIVETIKKLVDDDAYEEKTMGVIALQGRAQAQLIERLLAERLDPGVIKERRLRCGEPATFQGDERDVIFLSLVIAPNVNYRALTRLPDQRRFNVAMSRARDQVRLFHSVKPHDLSSNDLRYRLVRFFESPQDAAVNAVFEDLERLERAARGPRRRGAQPAPYESWFEVDVALELLRRRFRVRPQVEIAHRRIDLVVEGLDARIAVECDGDEWHGMEAYDHDMARQRQLERAGWTFVRVRESEFYVDRQRAVNAVVQACEELGIRPVDFVAPPRGGDPRDLALDSGSPGGADAEIPVDDEDRGQDAAETEMSSSIVGPFTGYSKEMAFPDPREASTVNVREALQVIIERDGPLTRTSVYRLYVQGCPGLQRGGKTIRQALNKALGAMLRAGEIVGEDELGDGLPDGQVLRVAGAPAVNMRPAGRRDLLEIPPSELVEVLRRLHPEDRSSGDSEALYRTLLERYGFSKLTKPRKEFLSRVLRLLSQTDDHRGSQEQTAEAV